MNIGRAVVGTSAALAIAAAAGFGYVVFASPSVDSYGAFTACMASDSGHDYFFGIGEVANNGRQDIVLLAVEPLTVEGLDVIDFTVPTQSGIGIVEASEEGFEEYGLSPVAGTIVTPGEHVDLVAQLTPVIANGFATVFEVTYKNAYGITHTAVFTNIVGFAPSSFDEDDDMSNCGT